MQCNRFHFSIGNNQQQEYHVTMFHNSAEYSSNFKFYSNTPQEIIQVLYNAKNLLSLLFEGLRVCEKQAYTSSRLPPLLKYAPESR